MKNPYYPPEKIASPASILIALLLIIFALETVVMFLLPLVLPEAHGFVQNLVDSLLLTALSTPFLWLLIGRPLRQAAMNEIARTQATLANIVDAVINFDGDGTVQSLNSAAEIMFGYTAGEIIGQNITRLIPEMEEVGKSSTRGVGTKEPGCDFRINPETVGCPKDGPCFPVEVSISELPLEGRRTFIAIIHDITQRKRMADLMTEQKEFVENLMQNCAVPIFVIDPQHQVLVWNRACEELTGIKAEAMLGRDETWKAFYEQKRPVLADMVIYGEMGQISEHYSIFGKSRFIPEGLEAEGWYKNLNGRDRYIFFNAAPIRNFKGEMLAVVETLEDLTERKQYEAQLEYQANHDRLTNLPNRNLLTDRVHQALLNSRRNHKQVAIFTVDLDNFKLVNDSLGQEAGDALLKIVAERLNSCVRSGDTAARKGGDEFAVIVSSLEKADDAAQIAVKIREAISQPLLINEHELTVTCSIGISIFPRDGEDVQTLLKNADVAMYRAKDQGCNTFQFYTGEMNARSLARMTMEKHLRRALENNELVLHYQPKVNLFTGQITSMEALLRWQSPELGMVSPGNFIPLAEETGLIEPIGAWVVRTACGQNKAWQDANLPQLSVAVNISARQFKLTNFADSISQVLRETGLEPRYLELEITESLVMQDVERVSTVLNELKGMGVLLSMDDFGTGYSSLSYLKRFPFDILKIDQSFVRDITSDPDSAAIANTVIAMAHSLHLKVVAEGVETEGQLEYLRSHGCNEMQGYYFSRPIPAAEFEVLLREGRRLQLSVEKEHLPKKTILVVDDEIQVTASLKEILLFEDYHVLTANSAAEGFELLATNRISVVISDLRMPVMSGTEFLSRVKELYPDTVRIIISGHADLDSVTDAINDGFVYKFINKPWKNDIILEKIAEAFKYHAEQTGKRYKDQRLP